MTIESSIFDISFFLILWLILLENTVSGYLMLSSKKQTFGCLLELSFTLVRMIFGIEDEEKRRARLLKSRLFRIEYTVAWIVGAVMLLINTYWIIYLTLNL